MSEATSMRRARAIIGCALLVTAAVRAEPTGESVAKQHFARGKELAAQAQYREAIDEFRAGYAASPRPLFLFNMGECARSIGDEALARDSYTRYLAADPNGALAATARAHLAELAMPAPTTRPPPTPPTTTPPPSMTPPPTTPPPAAAPHEPAAPAPTSPSVATSAAARLAPPPSSSPSIEPQPAATAHGKPVWKRWPLWVGVGSALVVGAIAVGVGVAYGGHASNGCGADCGSIVWR